MGKVQQGILDGFIGKVGTVVGSFWKGKPVMRGYKRNVRVSTSEAVELIRTRFASLGQLAGQFMHATRMGFKNIARAKQMTEGDIFVRLNWDHVHATMPGTATIDYADLIIAKGNLPEAQLSSPAFTQPLSVKVSQTDTSSVIGADQDDLVFLFVYAPEANAGILSDAYTRSEDTIEVAVPEYWNGMNVHVWGFAIGGGTENEGRPSNSRHLGSGAIS